MTNQQTEKTYQEKIADLKKTIKDLEKKLASQTTKVYASSSNINEQNTAQSEMIDTFLLLDNAKTRLIKLLQR